QFTCDCGPGSSPISSVRWSFGDSAESNEQNPMHTFLPGSYRVHLVVTDQGGLSSEDAVTITVRAGTRLPPVARAFASPGRGPAPLQVAFLATAVDLNGLITDLKWDFGDGTQASALDHVQKTFDAAGVYRVTLVAVGSSGLTATDQLTITV